MKKLVLYFFFLSLLNSCSSEISSPINTLNTTLAEFKWDFSKDQKIVYSLNQEQRMINDLLGEGKFDTTELLVTGKVILDIKKNESMDLILDSLKGKTKFYYSNLYESSH